MKSLIIGGSGFLGSHVADQLTISGHEVHVFDRAPSPWLNSEQAMIVGDLLNPQQLEAAVSDCEVVYNFAAIADLDDAIDKPLETVKINEN